MKQRTPGLVLLPLMSFFPLGFLPLSLAELGWLWEPRERGHFLLLPIRAIICSSFRYFPAQVELKCSYTHRHMGIHLYMHTHLLSIYIPACAHIFMMILVSQKACQTNFCHTHVIPSASIQLPTFFLQNDDAGHRMNTQWECSQPRAALHTDTTI